MGGGWQDGTVLMSRIIAGSAQRDDEPAWLIGKWAYGCRYVKLLEEDKCIISPVPT